MSSPYLVRKLISVYYLLHAGFLLGLFFDSEDRQNISSETSVDFQRTTRRYIPEGRTSLCVLYIFLSLASYDRIVEYSERTVW
jgi:hypothetical protein